MKRLARWIGLGHTEHEQAASLLSAYIDGRLVARERALVDQHLRDCTRCQAELATLQATVQAVKALPAVRVPRSFALSRSMARPPRPSWTFPIFRMATVTAAATLVLVVAADMTGLPARQLQPDTPATRVVVAYEHVAAQPQVTNAAVGKDESVPPQVTETVFSEIADASLSPTAAPGVAAAPQPAAGEAPSTQAPPQPPLPRPTTATIPEETLMGVGAGTEGGVGGMGEGQGVGTSAPGSGPAPTSMAKAASTASQPPSDLATAEMQPSPASRDASLAASLPPSDLATAEMRQATAAWVADSTPQVLAAQPEQPPSPPLGQNVVAQYASGRMRAIEVGLAALALISGALTLVSSGRLRRR